MKVVTVVGALMPRDHVASSSAVIRQPIDTVWAVVRDLGGVPAWWPEMTSATRMETADGTERRVLTGVRVTR